MQMTISTTGRRLLCILCFVYVLSKMLKLCSAGGSSFRFRWMLLVACSWGIIVVLLFGCCQPFVAEAASWCFIRLIDCVFTGCGVLHFNAECSEMKLVRWWACSGSNRLCLRFAVGFGPSELCFWVGSFLAIADGLLLDACLLQLFGCCQPWSWRKVWSELAVGCFEWHQTSDVWWILSDILSSDCGEVTSWFRSGQSVSEASSLVWRSVRLWLLK